MAAFNGFMAAGRTRALMFTRERRGGVAILFAILAPVLLILIGATVDYGRSAQFQGKLQTAADSAALAGTTALTLGQSAAAAQTTASNLFWSNAPSGTTGTFSAAASTSGTTMTTTVTFTGSLATTFGKLLNMSTVATNVTSTAKAASSSSGGSAQYAGNGSVAGDPHIGGADGSYGYFGCSTPSGSWYNLLSDSGIQINVSCTLDPAEGLDIISAFSILLGSHVISLSAPPPTYNAQGVASYNASTAWFGQITIDGVTYPAVKGQRNYLNGTVWVTTTDLTNFYASDNQIEIVTGIYTIFITFDAGAMGDINITAKNAGLCGVPGGFWGGTLAGHDDYSGADFLVSGPTATSTQFNWSTCPASSTTPYLSN